MQSDVREGYFTWLYDKVYEVRDMDSPHSYLILCDHMHRIIFSPTVSNDENREAEGIELRTQFIDENQAYDIGEADELLNAGPNDVIPADRASIFEVLVALANHCDYSIDRGMMTWFQDFVFNLKLGGYPDDAYEAGDSRRINRVLENFNDRKYDAYGKGGIFPLPRRSEEDDQRQVELWFQFYAYANAKQLY